MDYIEITAAVDAADAERAAVALRDATGQCASIEPPFAQPDLESGAIAVNGAPAHVRVYVESDAAGARSAARKALDAAGIAGQITSRSVAEEDWAESWKQYFDVERYGERIVVVPSWREHEARAGDITITLDPGMAFGTGQHETTRMCIEALERRVREGACVLDVGCGSGILSLVASKLGASRVMALDIDDNCVRITRENAARNGVAGMIDARLGTLTDGHAAEFAVIVANIVSAVIIDLAPVLVRALAPGGALIVSGIVADREGAVCDALRGAGARIESVRAMGEWRCVEAGRA